MKITQEADYAMRIIFFLSKLGIDNRIDANTLSLKEGIPARFTLKILRKLTQAGLTKAFRGVNGGYTLKEYPENITFKNVIEVIDGPMHINRCLYDEAFCNLRRTNKCEIHKALKGVKDKLIKELESINFKDLNC